MDFGALPPEVNSGLMYTGAGPGPLTEAAAAWSTLSQELSGAAQAYQSVIGNLATTWRGPSSSAMQTAAQPYLAWLSATAAHAEATAMQASAAVEAYSVAFAATVAPPVVAANRAQLLMLIATNLLGQNTPAIAANEAAYAAMWAQDAAAMYGYAASSSSATSGLPTFTPAPQTASGSAAQALAQAADSTNPLLQFIQTLIPGFTPGQPLQNLAELLVSPLMIAFVSSGQFAVDPIGLLGAFTGLIGIGSAAHAEGIAAQANAAAGARAWVPDIITTPPVEAPPPVIASAGASGNIGGMSVPPSWARPPEARVPQVTADTPSRDRYQAAIPAVPFMPVTGLRSNQGRVRAEPEYGVVRKVTPNRHPSGG